MANERPRNWLLKAALVCLGAALAGLGVLAWADKARVFEALSLAPEGGYRGALAFLAALDPLWPVFAVAALGCVAAQVIAACATVNFARLAKAAPIWRAVAIAFYAVSVVFAAFSADEGAKMIFGLPHRAAYEARETERAQLIRQRDGADAQTADLDARLLALSDAARDQGWPGQRLEMQAAPLQALRAAASQRAGDARASLTSRPALPRVREPAPWEALAFFVFLAWAALDPWGYPLAERGRVHLPGQAPKRLTRKTAPKAMARRSWLRWGAAAFGIATLAAAPAAAIAPVAESAKATPTPTPTPTRAPLGQRLVAPSATLRLVTPTETRRSPSPVTLEFIVETADRLAAQDRTVSMRSLAAACDTSYALIARRFKAASINIAERWPKPLKARAA